MEDQRPRLDCVILCDAISKSPEGKNTLYGLFDTINTKEFPCVHSTFAVFLRFTEGHGKFGMKLQILDPKDAIVFEGRKTIEIKGNLSFAGTEFTMQFEGFPFRTPGVYRIRVLLDDVPIDNDRSFRLRQSGEG